MKWFRGHAGRRKFADPIGMSEAAMIAIEVRYGGD